MRALPREPVVIDGRNLFDPALVQDAGIEYHPIGRAAPPAAEVPIALAARGCERAGRCRDEPLRGRDAN